MCTRIRWWLSTNDIENIELARNIGLPIIIKASGGGGGRGMQVVEKEENLLAAIELAKTEGLSFFGNAEVYMEKFLTTPRHVEIQILADEHGTLCTSVNATALCSDATRK